MVERLRLSVLILRHLRAEREALQKDVFPKLERYCAQRGARFQAVDLRWGITLGDCYGWESVPARRVS